MILLTFMEGWRKAWVRIVALDAWLFGVSVWFYLFPLPFFNFKKKITRSSTHFLVLANWYDSD